jgi:hypothetical protein
MYAYTSNNPVMRVDPSGYAFISILVITLVTTAVLTTGTALTYGAVTDTPVVLDGSVSIPIGAGQNLKLGASMLFDFENDNVQFYGHNGVSSGLSAGPSYSVGLVKNYEKEGDYAGPFVFAGGGYYWGVDHCFDPRAENHSKSVQATSVTFGWKGSGYIGYDDYYYWGKLEW